MINKIPVILRNYYYCTVCNIYWKSYEHSKCSSQCPWCGKTAEPYKSEEY